MLKEDYNVIGVMSGTSLDGVDLVYVNFKVNDDVWSFNCLDTETVSYTAGWGERLKNLTELSQKDLQQIDCDYTVYLAEIIGKFINKYKLKHIDAVCSHGHTALHQPNKGLTYQIGNRKLLAEKLNQLVVCDFRVQDVSLGGEGAPLVPIGDELLFKDYDFCLNLGGFANISTKINNERIAYDICPVNIVLNHYVNQLGFAYDNAGKIASSGMVSKQLLEDLNGLDFYKKSAPKSLGLEWVKAIFLPIIESYNLQIKDVLSTVCEHVAIQISKAVKDKSQTKVLITGGGAYNTYLIERLKSMTSQEIVIPKNVIVDFKEAIVFGLLGVLKLRNEINCLSSVTGAKNNHSSGTIFKP
ncbi:anhydro-N-acetylmuramic acid kinase [Mangrovimonas spongiae]|uniref:Anhydro-N-acetylmuramic acid kinase n=1 Tax=Mangrovimonas spongiae TaxID=2494697 RepID=A0A3R9NYZ8_9FLAO|nr:anhydro-N-acetylmuramic acid kinase [Mangrovimonas spongiae]RSK40658.1 anhydro-N-acetylmuramic acid kinase [Mangrovimonas spongiae]